MVPFNIPSIACISLPATSYNPPLIEGNAPPVVQPTLNFTKFLSAISFNSLYFNIIGPLLPVTTFIPVSMHFLYVLIQALHSLY